MKLWESLGLLGKRFERKVVLVHSVGLKKHVSDGIVFLFQGEFPVGERLDAHVAMLGLFVHDDHADVHHEVAHGDEGDAGCDDSEPSFEPPEFPGPQFEFPHSVGASETGHLEEKGKNRKGIFFHKMNCYSVKRVVLDTRASLSDFSPEEGSHIKSFPAFKDFQQTYCKDRMWLTKVRLLVSKNSTFSTHITGLSCFKTLSAPRITESSMPSTSILTRSI